MTTRPLLTFTTDQELYDALSQRDERAYTFLYTKLYPSFQYFVTHNSGSDMDAEDAFQKGLLSFMLNIETGRYQFKNSTRVTTVVFEYCKRVWYTELKSARLRTRSVMPSTIVELAETGDVLKDLERLEIVNVVQQALGQLKEECRKLIEWFYIDELSLRDIGERLGMKETSVRSKRYQCAEKLKVYYKQTAKQHGL